VISQNNLCVRDSTRTSHFCPPITLLSVHNTLVRRLMHRGPRTYRICCGRMQDHDSAPRCHASIKSTTIVFTLPALVRPIHLWASLRLGDIVSSEITVCARRRPARRSVCALPASSASPRPTLQLNDQCT
jgi:hypothetical protein